MNAAWHLRARLSQVMLLKFLLDRAPLDRHPGYGCIASALVAHLRTVRALELTLDVWKVGLSSLVKAEQAKKLHIVRKIENLLRVMVRESQDIKSRHLQAFHAHLQAFSEGRSSAAVAGIAQMVKEACEMDGSADAANKKEEREEKEEIHVLAATEQLQRPELIQIVESMLSGGAPSEATADLLLKRSSEIGVGDGALVSCIVRCAVNATVKEARVPSRCRSL